jgi:HAD superfamily hydrolase (TIGR01509 family)
VVTTKQADNLYAKAMSLQALIFDFDGTILDTETPEFDGWSELYAKHNATLELSEWSKAIGTWGAFDPIAHLEKLLGRELDRMRLEAEVRENVHARIAQAKVIPGVLETLDLANAHGIRLALASSSSRKWVVGNLERLGLIDRFESFSTQDDVSVVKPDPELYLHALSKLKLEPDVCVAIEDSPNGSKAGLAAKLRVIAVPNQVTKTLKFPAGVIKRSSLLGIDLGEF